MEEGGGGGRRGGGGGPGMRSWGEGVGLRKRQRKRGIHSKINRCTNLNAQGSVGFSFLGIGEITEKGKKNKSQSKKKKRGEKIPILPSSSNLMNSGSVFQN